MNVNTWIVVSNSYVARIFKVEKGRTLTELETFVNPASRMLARDLVSDRPGHGNESTGPSKHALEPRTNPKDNEINDFAKNLASHLETARTQGLFDRLYIAANPSFLGILRNEFTNPLNELIEKEINKDITTLQLAEMGKYFFV